VPILRELATTEATMLAALLDEPGARGH